MTPNETMAAIIALRQAGRFDEAAAHYAPDCLLVIQPGTILKGHAAVRDGLAAMSETFPSFVIEGRDSIETGNVALHHSAWRATGATEGHPIEAGGRTADVLVRRDDGKWMVLIDNPWGGALLDSILAIQAP